MLCYEGVKCGVSFPGKSCCRVLLSCSTPFLELVACCPLWMGRTSLTCEAAAVHTNMATHIFMHACHISPHHVSFLLRVPSMVNLGEIKLHVGVEYGKRAAMSHTCTSVSFSERYGSSSWILCPCGTSACLLPSRWFTGELQRVHLPNHETAAAWVRILLDLLSPAINFSLGSDCDSSCDYLSIYLYLPL